MTASRVESPARRKVDEIVEKAAEVADMLLREAHNERTAIGNSTRERIDRLREEQGRMLYEEIDRLHRESEDRTEIDVAREFESAHAESLSVLKEKFLSGVRNADAITRERWFLALLESAVSDLGVGVLHVRKGDMALASTARGFEIVGDLVAAGGLVAESADGTVLLDFTFESLAEDYWASRISEIRGMLFG